MNSKIKRAISCNSTTGGYKGKGVNTSPRLTKGALDFRGNGSPTLSGKGVLSSSEFIPCLCRHGGGKHAGHPHQARKKLCVGTVHFNPVCCVWLALPRRHAQTGSLWIATQQVGSEWCWPGSCIYLQLVSTSLLACKTMLKPVVRRVCCRGRVSMPEEGPFIKSMTLQPEPLSVGLVAEESGKRKFRVTKEKKRS